MLGSMATLHHSWQQCWTTLALFPAPLNMIVVTPLGRCHPTRPLQPPEVLQLQADHWFTRGAIDLASWPAGPFRWPINAGVGSASAKSNIYIVSNNWHLVERRDKTRQAIENVEWFNQGGIGMQGAIIHAIIGTPTSDVWITEPTSHTPPRPPCFSQRCFASFCAFLVQDCWSTWKVERPPFPVLLCQLRVGGDNLSINYHHIRT